MSRLLVLLCALLGALAFAVPARAHECNAWAGSCAFSEVVALGGAALTRVHAPTDLAVAPDGRVAVADSGAHRAVVLDAAGAPQFAAGADEPIYTVAFGPNGDLYTATDGRIRRYGTDGELKQEITEGLGSVFVNQPYVRIGGMAVGAGDRLYAIAGEALLVYGADGRVEREIRRATGSFSRDRILGAEGGRLFVSNEDAGRVEQLDADGQVVAAVTDLPENVWLPASDVDADGLLHLSGGSEIWTYDRNLAKVASVPHVRPDGGGSLAAPRGAFLFANGVADQLSRIDRSGAELPAWGTDPGTGLSAPVSVTVSGDGTAVVADSGNRRVVRFRPDGSFDRTLREGGAEKPFAVEMTGGGEVFVAYESGLVERVAPDGAVRASWRVEGPAYLRGLAVAPDGNLWIRNRGSLMRFTPDGALLGTLDTQLGFTFAGGNGLAVDAAGNLYAALEQSIRKLSPEGRVLAEIEAHLAEGLAVLPNGFIAVATQRGVMLTGQDGKFVAHWGDHETPAGRLFLPFDVAVDDRGRIFVADKHGQKVVRFTFAPAGTVSSPGVSPPPVVRLQLQVPAGGVKVPRSGVVTVRVGCGPNGTRCRGAMRITRRAGRATRTLASGRFDVPAGRSRAVRVRLRASGRRALRSAGRLRVSALATTRYGERVSRTFVLRAQRR